MSGRYISSAYILVWVHAVYSRLLLLTARLFCRHWRMF